MKQLLKQMDIKPPEDDEEDEVVTPPRMPVLPTSRQPEKKQSTRRLLSDEFKYDTKIEHLKQRTRIENRKYETKVGTKFQKNYGEDLVSEDLQRRQILPSVKKETTRVKMLMSELDSKKKLVIFSEIMGPPKSLQE